MTDEKDLMQIDEGTSAAEGSFGLLSVPEVSKLTGYHRDYVTYLARVGKLAAKKVGRNWVVSREAVDNLLNAANGHTEVADEMGNKIPVHVENYEQTERAKLQKLKSEVRNSITEVKQKAELEKVAQQNLQNAQIIEKQISSKLGDFESNLKKEFELLLDKKVANIPISAIRVISAPSSVYDPAKFEKTAPTIALSSFDPQSDLSKEILAVKTPTLNVEKIYSSFRHRFDLVKYFAYGFAVLTFTIGAAAVYNYKNTEDKIAKIKTEQTQLASKPEMIVVQPEQKEKDEEKIPEIVVTPPTTTTSGETKIIYVVGKPGPQGPRGPQGVQGEQGPAGADGKDGANGTVAYQPAYVVTPLPGYTGPNSSGSTFLSGTNISGQELNISGTANISTANITNLTSTTQNIGNGIYITGNAPYLETTSPGATLFINTVSNNPVEFGSGAITSAGPLTLLSTSQPQVTLGYNSTNKWTSSTANTGATTFAFNGATPSVIFTPENDTVTAFNFTKADGTSVFNVDTANGRVGINNSAPTVALDVTGAANISGAAALGGNLTLSAVNPVIDTTDSGSTLNINTVTNRPVTFGTGDVTIPNLVVTTSQVNSGTVNITSNVTTGTAFSLTGNDITSGTLFSKNMTANAGNGEVSKGGVINVVDNTTAGGGYSALTINITGSGAGSGTKTILDLNPGINKQVVFDNTGAFRPTVSSAQNTNSIGSPSYYWKNGYFDTINANSLAGTVITGATSSNTWTIGSSETGDTNKAIVLQRNSGSGNATIQWNAGTNDLRYLTVNYPFNSTYTVSDASIGTNVNLFSGLLTNNTTTGTQQLLALTNTGTGTTEKGLYINNTGTGTTAMQVDGTWTNGLLIGPNAGNVGIGTTAPGAKLEVFDGNGLMARLSRSVSQYIDIKADSGSQSILSTSGLNKTFLLGTADSNDLRLYTNNSARLNVTSAGAVGIGTTNPGQKLEVSEGLVLITRSANNAGIILNATGTGGRQYSVQSTDNTNTSGGGNFGIYDSTATTYRMVINSSGYVGIGVTNPTEMLDVFGNIRLGTQLRDNRDNAIIDQSLSSVSTSRLLTIGNATYATTALMGGNVGIGTTTPGGLLDVKGSKLNVIVSSSGQLSMLGTDETAGAQTDLTMRIGANNATSPNIIMQKGRSNAGAALATNDPMGTLQFQGGTGSAFAESARIRAIATGAFSPTSLPSALTFWTTAGSSTTVSERMRIDAAGNVGIGTTAPSTKLHIANTSGGNTLTLQGGSGATQSAIVFSDNNVSETVISRINPAVLSLSDGAESAGLSFDTIVSGTLAERMRIHTNGNVGIGTSTPAVKLQVSGAGTTHIRVTDSTNSVDTTLQSDSSGGWLRTTTNNKLYLGANSGTHMTVDTFGNVGIGTISPTSLLQVTQSTSGVGTVTVIAAGTTVTGVGTQFTNTFKIGDTITANAETHTITAIASDTSMTTDAWTGAASGVAYTLTGGTRFVVKGNGNIGIGLTNPGMALDIVGNTRTSGYLAAGGSIYTNFGTTGFGTIYGSTNGNGGGSVVLYQDSHATLPQAVQIKNGTSVNTTFLSGGYVGIGTTSPNRRLVVQGDGTNLTSMFVANNGFVSGTSGSAIALGHGAQTGDTYSYINASTAGGGTSGILALNSNGGNVGIGTTNPARRFVVQGDGTNLTSMFVANNGFVSGTSGSTIAFGHGAQTGDTYSYMNATIAGGGTGGILALNAVGGNVGVGTTAAGAKLHVLGAGNNAPGQVKIESTNTNYAGLSLYNGNTATTANRNWEIANNWASAGNLDFLVSTASTTDPSSVLMSLGSTGNLGLGVSNPTNGKLEVVGDGYFSSTGTTYLTVNRNAITNFGMLRMYTGGSMRWGFGMTNNSTDDLSINTDGTTAGSKIYIQRSSGNVGVGTTSPSVKLHVAAATGVGTTETMRLEVNGNVGADRGPLMAFYSPNNSGTSRLTAGITSAQTVAALDQGGYLAFHTNTTGGSALVERMRIDNVGNVGIGVTTMTSKLQVAGDLATTISSSVYGQFEVTGATDATKRLALGFNTTGNYGIIQSLITSNNYYPLMLNPNGSGVGIGTTALNTTFNPKLQIKNTAVDATNPVMSFILNRQNSDVAGLMLGMDAGQYGVISSNGTTGIRFGQNSTGSTAFTEYMRILTGGNVGIGTTNPNNLLTVNGTAQAATFYSTTASTNDAIYLDKSGDAGRQWIAWHQGSGTADWRVGMRGPAYDLTFYNAAGAASSAASPGAAYLTMQQSTGNIGIGITNPGKILDIMATSGSDGLRINRVAASTAAGGSQINSDAVIGGVNTNLWTLGDYSNSDDGVILLNRLNAPLYLGTNNTERITILGDGNVGIGTTNPQAKFHVGAGDMLLDYGGYYLAGRNFAGTGNLGLVNLQTAGLNNNVMSLYEGKAVILSSGNVGIGTTNPITKLQVAGAGSNTTVGSAFAAITLENSDATVNNWVGQGYYGSDKTGYIGYTGFQITDHLAKYGDYAITTRGAVGYTEKLRVTSEGNLGIGITNPSSGLHLATGTFGAPATGGSAANGFLRINNPATSAPGLDFGLNVSGTAYAWLQSRDYNNYANNYALAINPNGGNVGIGTTSPNYKLEIGQSATQTIALSNSNIAHGMTDQALTNVGAVYGLLSSTTGGALLQGFSDADATGFRIEAAIGAADPTDTIPAILLRGSKKNLTNLQELGALETLFQVQNMLNTPSFSILGNGNIGIGTTSPAGILDVRPAEAASGVGSSVLIKAQKGAAANNGGNILISSGDNGVGGNNGYIGFGIGAVITGTNFSAGEAMRIAANGSIGIGTTGPSTTLDVRSANDIGLILGRNTASGATGLQLLGGAGSTHYNWQIGKSQTVGSALEFTPSTAADGTTFSTPAMVLLSNGSIGIGTTNPTAKLDVRDATDAQIAAIETGSGNANRIIIGANANEAYIQELYSATAKPLTFKINTEKMRIDTSGNIGIGTTGQFGSGAGVIGIGNATTDPTTNPTGAGVLYVSGGALKYRGSSGTVTTVAAADYAEDMPYLGTLTSGEVVQQSSVANPNAEGIYNKFFVERADTPYADGILGIVSSFQGSNQTTTMPIALVGRVPVKITDENGAVKVGDYLTASASMPGYAMKATVSGKVIGQVLSEPDTTSIATQVINGVTIQTTTALTFVKVGYQNINNMMALGNDPLATAAAAAVANGNTAETQGNAAAGSLGAAEQGLTMVIRQAVNNIEKDSSGNKVAKAVTADILQLQSGKVTRLMVAASGATVINSSVSETSSEKIFVISNNGSEKFSISAKGTLVASATLVVKKDVVAIGAVLGSTGILARNADTVEVEQGDLVMFKGVEDKDILSSVGMNNPVLSVSKAAYDSSVGAGSVIVVGIADRNMSDFDIPGAGTSAAANATIVPSGEFLSVITAGTYSAVNADASNASIAVGDKLTLSTVAGKVRKLQAGENMPVVGIALDTLASGSGKIRIFLNISNAMTAVSGSSSTSSGGSTTSSTPTTEPVAPAADTTTTDTTAPADTTITTADPIAVTDTSTSAPLDVTSSPVDTGTSSVASDTTTATN